MNHNQPTFNKHAQAHNKPVLFEVNSARAVTRYQSQELVDKVTSELLGISLFEFRSKYINESPVRQEVAPQHNTGDLELYAEDMSQPGPVMDAIANEIRNERYAEAANADAYNNYPAQAPQQVATEVAHYTAAPNEVEAARGVVDAAYATTQPQNAPDFGKKDDYVPAA
jgi:hypothetical protein